MYDYLLFDLDGTIINSEEGIVKSFQYALNYYGIEENNLENLRRVIGPPLEDSFIDFYGFRKEAAHEAVLKYRERYEIKGWKEVFEYEGISDILEKLKENGKTLAIATCKPEHISVKILEDLGLTDYFDVIVGSDDDERRIKKNQVITEVINRLEIKDKSKILMIGDRYHDVEGALAIGIDCMGVRYGFAKTGELEKAGSKYIVDKVADIYEKIEYLDVCGYILDIPKFSRKTTLENLKYILAKLGNPQDGIDAIHVAGTNGKGSVCEFTSSILTAAGYKTGMFVSPHLVHMNERIRIDGKLISDNDFVKCFNIAKTCIDEAVKEGYVHPSFFEILFLMAAIYFKNENVDFGVFEVGLGGRLDATNSIAKPMVTAITSISLDHTEILGDTLSKIAGEKAGIIKNGVPVVYKAGITEVDEVIANCNTKCGNNTDQLYPINCKNINIYEMDDKYIAFSSGSGYYGKDIYRLPFRAKYQCENGAIALGIIDKIGEITGEYMDSEIVKTGFINSKWEGRMEQVSPGIYFDGGHNEDGITRFVQSANDISGERKTVLIFSVVKEKNYEKMIKNICDNMSVSVIIITDIASSRKMGTESIEDTFKKHTNIPVYVRQKSREALELGIQLMGTDGVLFCAGSLYLIGELKQSIGTIDIHKV